MRALLAELKRRHVDRVAIAYAVAGWLIAQVAALMTEAFELPTWVLRATIITLLLGFVVAVIVSWTYELTPQGLKRDAEAGASPATRRLSGRKLDFAIIGLLVIALGFALATHRTSQSGQDAPAVTDKSVAVLPFVNMSGDEHKEYLGEGISDTLIHALAQASDLKVISRTSSFQFKGKDLDVREIGQKLGVGAVLEGSVQQSGEKLRVIAQLINARDGTHYWSKTFDRPTADVFAIQDEIASEVLAALRISLLGAQAQRVAGSGTTNLAAYDAYLRARALFARRKQAALAEAVQIYAQAVELDPKYALAYVGLADVWIVLPNYDGSITRDVAYQRADEAVTRALALDPASGEAYAALAALELNRNHVAAAEKALKKALELAPGYAHAYFRYAELLREEGRTAEAYQMIRQAAERDPLSALIFTNLGWIARLDGRRAESEPAYRKAIALDPAFALAYASMGSFKAEEFGQLDEGVRWYRKAEELDPDNPRITVKIAVDFLFLDDIAGASAVLAKAQARWPGLRRIEFARMVFEQRTDPSASVAIARRLLAEDPGDFVAIDVVIADDLKHGRQSPELERFNAAWPDLTADPPLVSYATTAPAFQLAMIYRLRDDQQRAQKLMEAISAANTPLAKSFSMQGWLPVQQLVVAGDMPKAVTELKRLVDAGYRSDWTALRDDPLFAMLTKDDAAFQAQIARLAADAARMRERLHAKPELSAADLQPLAKP